MDHPKAPTRWTALDCMIVVFFATSVPLLWTPLTIYAANRTMFMVELSEVSLWLLVPTLLVTGVFTLGLLLLPDRLRSAGGRVLFGMGVLLWLQANVFAWHLGLLDGSPLRWPKYDARGLIDGLAWLILLPTIFVVSRKHQRFVRVTAAVMIAVQFGAALVAAYGLSHRQKGQGAISIDQGTKFTFSVDRNVIVLVLDSFQTTLFSSVLSFEPDLLDGFDGFKYYPNAVGGFQCTTLAMPLILTGQYYDNQKPYAEYIKEAYSGTSLPKSLKANGFRSEFYTAWDGLSNNSIYADPSVVDNVVPGRASPEKTLTDLEVLLATTLFRGVPYYAKKSVHAALLENLPKAHSDEVLWVYRQATDSHFRAVVELLGDQLFSGDSARDTTTRVNNSDFLSDPDDERRVDVEHFCFKYYHLVGIHDPLIVAGKIVKDSPEALLGVARSLVRDQMLYFLNYLKRRGVYDHCMIFIVGDHGRTNDVRLQEPFYAEHARGRFVPLDARLGRALPLFLYKPLMARGAMQTSMAPVTLADIAPTVFEAFGIHGETQGVPLQRLTEDTVRERRFYALREFKFGDYMPPMEEYVVKGFSWLDASCRETGWVYGAGKRTEVRPARYALGTPLTFGRDGRVEPFLSSGWNWQEESVEGHQAQGAYAKLRIPVERQDNDLRLSVQLTPSTGKDRKPGQQIRVVVNEQELTVWTARRKGEFTVAIPKALTESGDLNICFDFPGIPINGPTPDQKEPLPQAPVFHTLTVSAAAPAK